MRAEKPNITRSQMEHLIDEWVFSKRDRDIVKARLLEGLYYEELSSEFHLCERQIKTIVYKYQKIIYQKAEKYI